MWGISLWSAAKIKGKRKKLKQTLIKTYWKIPFWDSNLQLLFLWMPWYIAGARASAATILRFEDHQVWIYKLENHNKCTNSFASVHICIWFSVKMYKKTINTFSVRNVWVDNSMNMCVSKGFMMNRTQTIALTHCGLVMSWRLRSGSMLAQVIACCQLVPSYYLNQCWLIISGVLWHSTVNNHEPNP